MSAPLKLLFVCGKNLRRSPTAERIFQADPRLAVRSAGVSEKSGRRVQEGDLAWADLVLVMEPKHAARIRAAFPSCAGAPPIVSLDVPDDLERMDPELVEILRVAVEGAIERALQGDGEPRDRLGTRAVTLRAPRL